jgi:hypothetical protein
MIKDMHLQSHTVDRHAVPLKVLDHLVHSV